MTDAFQQNRPPVHVVPRPAHPPRQLWVVGDRFHAFAGADGVHTVSDLAGRIRRGEFAAGRGPVLLHAGQGVGEYERDYLHSVIAGTEAADGIWFASDPAPIAGRATVHKHRPDNVLLGDVHRDPAPGGAARFTASLRLSGDNELLHDHQTGWHVQGMVAVEAARQMFLGVFEAGYRHRWPAMDYTVVWNHTNLSFHNFLFPLPAEVTCVVTSESLDDPTKLDFAVTVDIHQGGRLAASAEIGFTAFDKDRISAVERRRGEQAIAACAVGGEHVGAPPAQTRHLVGPRGGAVR